MSCVCRPVPSIDRYFGPGTTLAEELVEVDEARELATSSPDLVAWVKDVFGVLYPVDCRKE